MGRGVLDSVFGFCWTLVVEVERGGEGGKFVLQNLV